MNDKRIALITGASRGFGRSMASHLTSAGVLVIGTYNHSAAEAERLTEEVTSDSGTITFLPLDVSRAELFGDFARDVAQVLSSWGAPDGNPVSTTLEF